MAKSPAVSLDQEKPTILVVDTGLDERLIDAVRRRYGDSVNVVAISTVPANWNGDFSTLTDPRHLNSANKWLFDKSKIDHLVLVKEDAELGYPDVKQIAGEINALGLNIKGILSHPYNAFIDLEMAELTSLIPGLERYPSLKQVSTFKDKPATNAFLRQLKEKYHLDDLIDPWEATIESAGGGALQDKEELKRLVHEKINDYIAASAEAEDSSEWEITVKGKPIKVSSDDPLLSEEAKKSIAKAVAIKSATAMPWKFILKPVSGDGSLGVVELNSTLSAAEIDKRLDHHWNELQATRIKKSILQEFVGDIEIGYHGYKNGNHIHHELTLKEMYGTKEIAHTDPGARGALYKRWQKKIIPVMEKIFEELDIDIGQINGDLRMNQWHADFCPVDLQARSGFGHPEMKNAVYASDAEMKKNHGKDVEQLLVAMYLDMGEDDVADAAAQLAKLKPKRAAIAATISPEGGHFLLSNVTDARLEAARRMPGILELSIPDINPGDRIAEIKSLPTTEGHIFIAATGEDLQQARENANNALAVAGVALIRPDDEKPEIKGKISTSYNASAESRAFKGEISPFVITASDATEAEVSHIAHALNYGDDESTLSERVGETVHVIRSVVSSMPETDEGFKDWLETERRKTKGDKVLHTQGDLAVAEVYQQAVADHFSVTERTHPSWNGATPSFTLVKTRQAAHGTRWHNGAKGPEALFRAREERLARRRKSVGVKHRNTL